MELTVGFHESLTCLTVCGQDRVCAAESIWTEGGKSGLEKTTTGPGCRTHIHFAWWTWTRWCILSSLLKSVLQLLWWWCSRSTRTMWQYEAQTGQKPSPGFSCAPFGFIKYSWSHYSGYCVRHRQAFVFWILIMSVSELFQSWKASVKWLNRATKLYTGVQRLGVFIQ